MNIFTIFKKIMMTASAVALFALSALAFADDSNNADAAKADDQTQTTEESQAKDSDNGSEEKKESAEQD